MSKSKVHEVVIKVRFDKRCTGKLARILIEDQFKLLKNDSYYCHNVHDDEPQEFKVTKVRKLGTEIN